ncbi:hypothetical protein PBMFNG_PBMFNG_14900, partial [Dysosmobacter welbionis]
CLLSDQMRPQAGLQLVPHRGHAPQIGHDPRQDLQDIVDLLRPVLMAQAQPEGAVSHLVGPPQGQQH